MPPSSPSASSSAASFDATRPLRSEWKGPWHQFPPIDRSRQSRSAPELSPLAQQARQSVLTRARSRTKTGPQAKSSVTSQGGQIGSAFQLPRAAEKIAYSQTLTARLIEMELQRPCGKRRKFHIKSLELLSSAEGEDKFTCTSDMLGGSVILDKSFRRIIGEFDVSERCYNSLTVLGIVTVQGAAALDTTKEVTHLQPRLELTELRKCLKLC